MAKKNKIAAKIAAKNMGNIKNVETAIPLQKSYRFDFLGKSKFVVIISTVFIIVGIIFFFIRGL